MGAVYDALTELAPIDDAETLDGYQRYESLLDALLTPEQIDTYAEYLRRTGTIRIFDELTPDELADLTPDEDAIATAVMADEMTSMENRRVSALLNQHGQHDVAPDLRAAEDTRADASVETDA